MTKTKLLNQKTDREWPPYVEVVVQIPAINDDWRCFTKEHDPDKAVKTYTEIYGAEPERVYYCQDRFWLGPIKGTR